MYIYMNRMMLGISSCCIINKVIHIYIYICDFPLPIVQLFFQLYRLHTY